MSFNVKWLLDKAFTVKIQEFAQLTDDITEILKAEEGHIGNLTVKGKLVATEPEGEAIVVGDLHGDLETLMQMLDDSKFIDKMQKRKKTLLVFLGDYGDRGVDSAEVFYVVLKLKEAYPLNVVLLRGNHEGPNDLLPSPHDLPMHLQRKFGAEWSLAYEKLRVLFDELCLAMLVKQKMVMLHGGVPSTATSIEDLAFAHRKHPAQSHLEEILWSDPEENLTGTLESPRGAGKLFGIDVTEKFLRMLDVKILIRGHEPAETGYKINHDGRILTLFSRKGEPYFNSKAAYLMLNLGLNLTSVYQLVDSVRILE
jgi:diadenosine tetraphosphatase ApaH/serine/threonine PP2A family protein phosphatase